MFKRITFLLIAGLALLLSTCVPAHAQGWDEYDAVTRTSDEDAGLSVRFQGNIDSVESYRSDPFQLSGYQGESFYDNPVRFRYKNVSAAGKPYITAYVYGNLGDTTWFVIDTLCTKDSAEVQVTGSLNLNGWKCYAYKLEAFGDTSGNGGKNRDDTVSEVTFFISRKNYSD